MWVKKCVKIRVILFKNWKHVFKWVYQTRPFSPIFIFLCFLLFFIFISPRLCFVLFSFFPISCVKIKCFKVVVLLLTETKKPKMHTQNDLGPVWWVSLNSHFHILNNITHIFTYFFTHMYFKKLQTTILKLLYQTSSQNGPELYLMWNKGISHFSLHTNIRFFAGSDQNGTKFKTLITLLLLYIFILFLFCFFFFLVLSISFHDWPSHWMFCSLHIDLPSPLPNKKRFEIKKSKATTRKEER